ncbi:MAG: 3'-phosphoesterase [Spirochaetales bacterium]|nr:3'-phosphoesterase [Spirochaetales bacterium]
MARGLKEYRDKRDFRSTGEPRGAEGSAEGRGQFVIQQHRSRGQGGRVHFDLRLEIEGALASWAVPKGPSTDPAEKRLALRVEDHPLDYAGFEGVIPEGEYGAGTVLVWDRGPYRNLREDDRSMKESLEEGKVEVSLQGKKLQGGYALVRTGSEGERERWLLVKMDDEAADARRNPVSTEPESVLTGRTLDEIAAEDTGGQS